MDDFKQRLQRINKEQEKLAMESKTILQEYESHDLLQENQQLQKSNDEIKKSIHDLKEKQKKIEAENSKLRQALQEQMLDEKRNILKVSKAKLTTYFGHHTAPYYNRLKNFEVESQREIKRLMELVSGNLQNDKEEIISKLKQTSLEIKDRVVQNREMLAKQEKDLLQGVSEHYDELAKEEITEEVMKKRVKENQIELKIGLNWINRLGILLIILGVGAAFRYSYANWFNDYFKGGGFFALGILMLLAGELFYRKDKRTFALGILGGGIAVLYGSIFFSYFLLEIIGLYPALLLSVVVTATAVALSLRYHSRTICSFGLVGGYFPLYSYILAFGLEGNAVYAAMGYLLILSISILWISFQKQWSIVHYISFLFNIPSMLVLIALSSNDLISMGYSILTFLIYLAITIVFSFKHKVSMKTVDVVLLGINTFISCTILYYLFNALGWNDLRGLLALIFCVLYIGLGMFIEQIIPKEKQTKVLFYGTALTFGVLIIPFQFGVEWLAFGWLVEAVVLMIYANRTKLNALEKAGWLIFLLC
ncbi:DUF2339 domain-containing protein, partial [Evansella sp. AB-P1]|uniref:DUF2339 domain-containing protein n=1 Tax=Evansella sp. AB-P1 TaxID=3037653 RepID=UPI00241C3513